MDAKYDLRVFENSDKLCEEACDFIVDLSRKSISERRRFTISLSGGNTPLKLYQLLSQPSFSAQIDWNKTYVFWGDERCVPLNDESNNAYQAKLALLNKVVMPSANIFAIPVDLSPEQAALTYEKVLKGFFTDNPPEFDLILLGLGENGHTASLFPGTDVIHEKNRWVKEVYVEEQKMYRITMTAQLINRAHNIIFLVTGSAKAVVLDTVLTGSYEPDTYPAQLVKPVNGNLYWLVDKEAAANLS